MKYNISRYNLNKQLIAEGELVITRQGVGTHLLYTDELIMESATALYHPIKAFELLREILEVNHSSLLACMGCRIDSAYRATGHYGTYLIEPGLPARQRMSLFESTDAPELLCTVAEHKAAYLRWVNFFRNK